MKRASLGYFAAAVFLCVHMKCAHKHRLLSCKWCSQAVCANCLDLKAHACPNIAASLGAAKAKLASQLPKVVASKVTKV